MTKILRTTTTVFRNAAGQLLKLQDDNYIEPKPNVLQIEVEVDAGQTLTIPSPNSFTYVNTLGVNVSSGVLVYDYLLSWGDESTIDNVTAYNSPLATHTYLTKGKFLIEITSTDRKFPAWDCYTYSAIRLYITRVISWGDVGLKKFNLYGCTALVTLPEQRSKLTTLLTAQYFCQGCTSLTAIPYGIFFKTDTADFIATDFSQAFQNNYKLLSINSELFRDTTEARNFTSVFQGCSKIVTIPTELFYNCPKVTSFNSTFRDCVMVYVIPPTLFIYNTASSCNFTATFYNCDVITFVPAHLFDTVHSTTFGSTFYNCNNLQTIPEYLFIGQNICATFYQCFYNCPKLQGVPVGVFDLSVGGVNACTSMGYCFQSCGTDASITTFTIADNLFDDLYAVTSFMNTFAGCSKFAGIPNNLFVNCVAAQDFKYTFQSNKHTSIPSGLFSTCVEATTFAGCFASNTLLESAGLPSDLFANCTKATSFGDPNYTGTFQGCSNVAFTTIPATLFSNCYNAVYFRNTFGGCTYLEAIPTDLLRYNTVITDVAGMFSGTKLSSLSANVFQYNPSIVTVISCFSGCTSLITVDENLFNTNGGLTNAIVDFSSVFQNSNNVGFISIPENIFRYSINAKNFSYAFQGTKLTSLPSGLFQYNTIIENLTSCFYGCIFQYIPATLFAGLTQVSTVQTCFFYCHELLEIPATLFDSIGGSRTVTFSSCFQVQSAAFTYNKVTGSVPELWTKPNSPIGTACFRNRTLVSNYADIPADWK